MTQLPPADALVDGKRACIICLQPADYHLVKSQHDVCEDCLQFVPVAKAKKDVRS